MLASYKPTTFIKNGVQLEIRRSYYCGQLYKCEIILSFLWYKMEDNPMRDLDDWVLRGDGNTLREAFGQLRERLNFVKSFFSPCKA